MEAGNSGQPLAGDKKGGEFSEKLLTAVPRASRDGPGNRHSQVKPSLVREPERRHAPAPRASDDVWAPPLQGFSLGKGRQAGLLGLAKLGSERLLCFKRELKH